MVAEFPSRLSNIEASGVVVFIALVYYVFLFGGLHALMNAIVTISNPSVVWRSEEGLWDHPEPNYKILPFVAEFFASATAIPLAGGVLLYQALRFSYNTRVLVLFLMDCWMYTCAFFSHMLLWPLLNCVTLSSVLTNALYTFVMYSSLAGGPLRRTSVRVALGLVMWIAIIYMVIFLPPWFGKNGGVPALLTIQTPAVISAMLGAFYCKKKLSSLNSPHSIALTAYNYLCVSGTLLVMAMAVSLVEVLYGHEVHRQWTGVVPVLHMVIHILEQIGIYLYGVGVSVIEHTLVSPVKGAKSNIRYVWNSVPYLCINVAVSDEIVPKEFESPPRRSPRLVLKNKKDM